jgi:hypothetical protein
MNDAQVNGIKRHAEVVAEALHRDIRQIAEGHSGIQRGHALGSGMTIDL